MKLRLDIRNALRCAADAMEGDDDAVPGGYAAMLRNLAKHLEQLARDPGMWSEFAEVYCLEPEDLK